MCGGFCRCTRQKESKQEIQESQSEGNRESERDTKEQKDEAKNKSKRKRTNKKEDEKGKEMLFTPITNLTAKNQKKGGGGASPQGVLDRVQSLSKSL